ncbi:hypothetical protein BDW02DRAFT_410749 [Decorospora gaudefroyi]|uniref:Uncharacterized protein n=1 Tax=Decorospora gaudefroyi TaxID=184978 RepID=A0A6A5KHC7_9PLEO|nr:hypothetical protein BDW02DRAFT_410749 [Decorospora gaudefroyi]
MRCTAEAPCSPFARLVSYSITVPSTMAQELRNRKRHVLYLYLSPRHICMSDSFETLFVFSKASVCIVEKPDRPPCSQGGPGPLIDGLHCTDGHRGIGF